MGLQLLRLKAVRLGQALAWAALAGLGAVALRAEITLAPLFADGAVLQCDKPVAVWGTAEAGEKLAISFAGQSGSTKADADGRWVILLEPMPVRTIGADLTVAGKKDTVVIHDVVVGEVWLCSGQSNMEFTVRQALNAEREIAAAQYPLLRHIRIVPQTSATPETKVTTSGWKAALPAHVGDFTAVGYFFARDIHLRLGVPVGLVHSSWGGTPIEAWMSPMALADPAFGAVQTRWAEATAKQPGAQAEYEAKLASWTAAEAAAKAQGEKTFAAWRQKNPKPYRPRGFAGDPWAPAGLFNGMIHPLLPYGMRGVLWYQGESNADHAGEYDKLFAAMITTWRAHFGQGDLPFYWVNLAAWRANDPTDMSWAWLREAQTKTLVLPNTGQALAIDLGDPVDIHPRNKQEVGRRLALLAKHRVYELTADDTGPTFESATREGATLRVRFTDVSGGLISHDKPPQALEIAGADRVFKPAAGRIDRDTLVVSSAEVKEPVAVRYAWRNCPDANLFSGTGLPVVPFRSDNW
ncbi:sialate O-acetylesterase [Opitutus sp. ER46]|uniref:sialate O-acetylesterase n=1 Tax=Opitutus sp. ER46 TaxID=2161864 RepID=UPI000D31E079|nr:sialate O-acetylesterase [Opitutus sp. ER46]PTX98560.1 sialate O-acetylesterase [Opitutus sp. ER46]